MEYIKSLEWMSKLVILNWGIIQHSKLTTPSQEHPSSVDDNARATVLFSEFQDVYQDKTSLETTFNFIVDAFESRTDGYPNNYKNKNGKFQGRDGVPDQACDLNDCYGRAIYAFARLSRKAPEEIRRTAKDLFLKYATKPHEKLHWTNSLSLAGIAQAEYLKSNQDTRIRNNLIGINEKLKKRYKEFSNGTWIGPDNKYKYDAYRSAEALITIGIILKDSASIRTGLEGIIFLNKNLIKTGIYQPIGNDGWFQKGSTPAKYSQQGIDAAGEVEANIAAYNITSQRYFLEYARKGHQWFLGKNTDGLQIVLPTGEVQDGIHAKGKINKNCGAESVIAYITTVSRLRN